MATPHQLSPGSTSSGAVKTRRSHRKSRNGCSECKRRHIRCDERRPTCSNCSIVERICSFPPPQKHVVGQQQPLLQPHSPADDPLSPFSYQSHSCEPEPGPGPGPSPGPPSWPPLCGAAASELTPPPPPPPPDSSASSSDRFCCVPPPSSSTPPLTLPSFTESFNTPYHPPAPPASLFTTQHLMLFHHASTTMGDGILAPGHTKVVLDIAVRHAVDAPYLIDQVLALSALHLAITTEPGEPPHPAGTSASFRHQATELQTRAVSSFTRRTAMVPADDMATCVPRFLFASILGMQVLAETLRQQQQQQHPHHQYEFHGFIERMVECIHIHRGMLTLIRPTWNYLMQSELQPLLRITNDASIAATTLSPGTECLPLEQLIQASTTTSATTAAADIVPRLDPASAEACRSAIRRLQWAFDMHNSLPSQDLPHAPSGFIVIASAEYVDVLRTHRPEALIILAYLGVLLHRCRRFWTFGDAGANMIRAIAGHLGSQWHEALAWPLKVVETENG